MKNTYDLQLLELAVRRSMMRNTKWVNGLGRSIESYVHPPRDWKTIKDAGVALFAPEKGGSYTVFETRPVTINASAMLRRGRYWLKVKSCVCRNTTG